NFSGTSVWINSSTPPPTLYSRYATSPSRSISKRPLVTFCGAFGFLRKKSSTDIALFDRHCQGIAMQRDQRAQVRPDLRRRLKSRRLGRSLRVGCGKIASLGIMLQIAVAADGERVPRRTLVAHEDQVLRQSQLARVSVLHLSLLEQ